MTKEKKGRISLIHSLTKVAFVGSMSLFFSLHAGNQNASEKKDYWDGNQYAKNSKEQENAARISFSGITLKGNESILDIGCGSGKITNELSDLVKNGTVTGVDISASMIKMANTTYAQKSNLDFFRCDVKALPFEESFDFVVSFTALQWVKEQLTALGKISQSLKANGKFLIEMPTGMPKELEDAVNYVKRQSEWRGYFEGFDPGWKFFHKEEYRTLLTTVGLTPVDMDERVITHTFPNYQAFYGFIRQWFPFLRALPEDRKDTFLELVLSRYVKSMGGKKSHPVPFNVSRLRAFGVKISA